MPASIDNIILFDGVCNFCNFWVNIIMDRDVKSVFKFASLQSEAEVRLTEEFSINTKDIETVILISHGKYFIKSEATIRIARELTSFWEIFYYLRFIPCQIRDFLYDIIAKNRYSIFGKRESCRIPTEEEKSKFIV